jgi:BON domain
MSVRTIGSFGGVVLAGGLAFGAMRVSAQTGATLPDAQIESNVLKALAGATDLSTQNIQTSTVYGTVTLTGNVHDETLRTEAENLASRVHGVKKVVDELTLGDTPAPAANDPAAQNQAPAGEQPDSSQSNQPVLQSDGTYAPSPDGSGAAPPPADAQNGQNDGGAPPPPPQGGYSSQKGQQQGPPPSGRQPMGQNYGPPQGNAPVPGGQQAGLEVTVPAGAMLRIRINRGLDSNHIQPGTPFDGIVLTDVVAGGAVAIPRGASVTGTVIDAKKAGVFKGEGELSLQLTSLTLGGKTYPLASNIWGRNGRDKTAGTVNNTVGLGVVGAVIGAVAGGGEGAAIGAGVGAGAGLAGSAASPRGQIIIPPESVLTFSTASPAVVRTVSEQEMARLSYAAGPQQSQGPPRVRYYSPYYGYYYGPPR